MSIWVIEAKTTRMKDWRVLCADAGSKKEAAAKVKRTALFPNKGWQYRAVEYIRRPEEGK